VARLLTLGAQRVDIGQGDVLTFAARIDTVGRTDDGPAARLDGVIVQGRLTVPELHLDSTERLLVTGPNGAGKSTLLHVLAGELRPDAGTVKVSGRVGHLRQEEVPWPPELTVLAAFAHGRPDDRDEHADRLLSLGLFEPRQIGLRIGELSYGQRRRIELARLVSEPVDRTCFCWTSPPITCRLPWWRSWRRR
jgi:macrolide transport system ATP-binding/permease protein